MTRLNWGAKKKRQKKSRTEVQKGKKVVTEIPSRDQMGKVTGPSDAVLMTQD